MEEETKEEVTEDMAFPGVKGAEQGDLIKKANDAADRLEAANKETKEILSTQAKAKAERILGGEASAGKEQKTQTDEEKEIASARAMILGTGYEDELFPKKEE